MTDRGSPERDARRIIVEVAMPIFSDMAAQRLAALQVIEKAIDGQSVSGSLAMLELQDQLASARASLDRVQLAVELLRGL